MGSWIRRHRTKYVFNHEVEGMEHVLEAVLCSSQPDPQKRQQIEDISQKGRHQHPGSDVRAVLHLAINWALQGHTELQVSSGFKLFSSWTEHHVAALENVLTRDLLSNLLTKPSRNQANLPPLLTQALTLLHRNNHLKLFQQLLKVVDAKAPAYLQESPELPCLKSLLQMLVTFKESLPKGDLGGRLAGPVLHVLASSPIPENPVLVSAFIRDVSAVVEDLRQVWGLGAGGAGGGLAPLHDCLKELFRILAVVDGPEPSPCLGALLGLFAEEVAQSGIRTLVTDSKVTEGGVSCALRRLLGWLAWPTCRHLHAWVVCLLRELAASGKFSVLVSVTETKVEEVMEKIRYPAVREASFTILSHMLLGFQHSSLPFHKILPMVPELLAVLQQEGGEGGQEWRGRLGRLIHHLMFLHTGFPDLYDPILDLIKDIPCPTPEEMTQRLAESRWTVQQYIINNNNTNTTNNNNNNGAATAPADVSLELWQKSNTGKVGLANLGNTCYMNSVLQTLFMCDEFRRQAVGRPSTREEKLLSELQRVFATLLLSQRPAWKPHEFLEASRPSWFARGQQQDCSEFLKYLLDQIHEQQLRSLNTQIEEKEITFKNSPANGLLTNGKASPSKAASSGSSAANSIPKSGSSTELTVLVDNVHDSTLVRKAFGFKVQSTYRCLTCQQESQRVEDFLDIPLAFPETGSGTAVSTAISPKTLVGGGSHQPQGAAALKQQDCAVEIPAQDAEAGGGVGEGGGRGGGGGKVTELSQLLGHYLTAESLVGDNQYHCDRCCRLQDGERTICLLESPQYLILVLLRFAFDAKRQVRSKIFREVTCPRTLAVHVARNSSNNNNNQKKTSRSPTETKRYNRLLKHLQPKLPSGVTPSSDNLQVYGLCSVIVHSGASSECGHYYCYARHSKTKDVDSVLDSLDKSGPSGKDGQGSAELEEEDFLEDEWCLFNDERVSRAAYTSFSKLTQRYPSDTPYMLVYKRLSLANQQAAYLPDTPVRQDMCDAVNRDNSVFVKEQEEAAKVQTGRSRSMSTSSVTLDTWQDENRTGDPHHQQACSGGTQDDALQGQESSVFSYVF